MLNLRVKGNFLKQINAGKRVRAITVSHAGKARINGAVIHVPKSPSRQKADRHPPVFPDDTFKRNETVPIVQLEELKRCASIRDKRDFMTFGRALDFKIYPNLVPLLEIAVEHEGYRRSLAHTPQFSI